MQAADLRPPAEILNRCLTFTDSPGMKSVEKSFFQGNPCGPWHVDNLGQQVTGWGLRAPAVLMAGSS